MGAIVEALGAQPTRLGFDFVHAGRAFRARYSMGGRNRPPSLELATEGRPVGQKAPPPIAGDAASPYRSDGRVQLPSPAPLVFRTETKLDRFGKRVGLSREVQTGDGAFDARVYVEDAGPPSSVVEMLSRPRVRASVLALLDAGALEVRLETDGMLSARVVMPPADLTADRVRRLATMLAELAEGMPLFAEAPRRRFTVERMAAWVALGAVAMLGIALLFRVKWEPLEGGLLRAGILLGIGLWLASMVGVAWAARRRSTGFRMFLITAFFGSFGVPAAAVAALLLVNCGLDGAPADAHTTKIVKRYISHGRYTLYYVVVEGWRPGAAERELGVTPAQYDGMREGQTVQVVTRPGTLGWEWLDSIR